MNKNKIYADDLHIDLDSDNEKELFKWFLASLLFGKPIQQRVAKSTFFEFAKAGLTTPSAIIKAGWDQLVKILDKGHYVRFDFSTATKLLEICKQLLQDYGSITHLLKSARNKKDLAQKLQQFKGIGPVTSRIFIQGLQKSNFSFS